MSVLELDGIEARGDPGGPIRVPGEEDVLGQVSRSESDVVLPFPFRDRDPAISGTIDAGIRVRQDLSLAHVAASLARNSGEDRLPFVRASSVAERGTTRRPATLRPRSGRDRGHAQAHARPTLGPRSGHVRPAPGRPSGGPSGLATGDGGQPRGDPSGEQPAGVAAPQEGHRDRRRLIASSDARPAPAPGRPPRSSPKPAVWTPSRPPSESSGAAGLVCGREPATPARPGRCRARSPPGRSRRRRGSRRPAARRGPMTLIASPGSTSAIQSAAASRSTTGACAVPSSSVKPSGRRSTTRPPTRTSSRRSRPGPRGRHPARTHGVAVLPAPVPVTVARWSRRTTGRLLALPPRRAPAPDVPPPTDVAAGPRQDRRPLVAGARVGRADDADDLDRAALEDAVDRDPARPAGRRRRAARPRRRPRRATGRPACGRLDAAGDRHEPPGVGGVELPADPERRRARRRHRAARSTSARRRGAPYAVPTRPDGPDPRADARRRRVLRAAGPRSRRSRPGRRSAGRSRRAALAGAVTTASIATSRSVVRSAAAIETARVSAGALADGRGAVSRRRFGVGVGVGDGDVDGAATSCRSAVAHPDAVPVERALLRGALARERRSADSARALTTAVAAMPLDASAMTLTRVPPAISTLERDVAAGRLGGLVDDDAGQADEPASVASPGRDGREIDRRRRAGPAAGRQPPAAGGARAGRTGRPAAARTSSTTPATGGVTPSGSLTTMPPVASAIARSAGVPRRPASAVTTPRTVTVDPTAWRGRRRWSATVVPGVGLATGTASGRRWRRRRGSAWRGRRRSVRRSGSGSASAMASATGSGGGASITRSAASRHVQPIARRAGARAVALPERPVAVTGSRSAGRARPARPA